MQIMCVTLYDYCIIFMMMIVPWPISCSHSAVPTYFFACLGQLLLATS